MWSPPPSESFLGLVDGLAFLTVTSLSGMLVSPFWRGSDTNKNTNNFAGYQQTLGRRMQTRKALLAEAIVNEGE
jgi:hypothetical protein